ncbi:cytochrome c oxidase subunit II [Steroidobacter cummioxidans]|uniref:cytochrome c oxidase subunit II n=1 Tax=Steroidobacter cummioxidans TaxID=1803913 RepID=UPI0019D45835|nr:cytochrome c oxidase subunit II [Steroidobacter cummioxidans]
MNTHGMQRMTRDGDGRTHVLFGHGLHRRTPRIGPPRQALFGFTHALPPNAAPADLNGLRTDIAGRGFNATPHRHPTFLILASLCALGGCGERPLSSLDAAGPAAGPIVTLWWAMFVAATALFVLVVGLLWLAYRKPGYAANTSVRAWLLGGGVLMPVAVLTVLATYAFYLGERLIARSDAQVMQVQAIALMWDWQFRYPQMDGAASTPVLHIPAGEPVDVIVTSNDVIHSFWIPRLAGKIDAIPGHETKVRLQADEPGEYEGQCAEFCGIGHADMRFKVIAHAADEYRAAVLRNPR